MEGSAQISVGRAEHSSRCWLPISLYPHAESSGALELAVLGMSMCHCVCVTQRARPQAQFLPCFESVLKCQKTFGNVHMLMQLTSNAPSGSCCELRCGEEWHGGPGRR